MEMDDDAIRHVSIRVGQTDLIAVCAYALTLDNPNNVIDWRLRIVAADLVRFPLRSVASLRHDP